MIPFFEKLLLILTTHAIGPFELGGQLLTQAECGDYIISELEQLLEICSYERVRTYRPEVVGFMEEV